MQRQELDDLRRRRVPEQEMTSDIDSREELAARREPLRRHRRGLRVGQNARLLRAGWPQVRLAILVRGRESFGPGLEGDRVDALAPWVAEIGRQVRAGLAGERPHIRIAAGVPRRYKSASAVEGDTVHAHAAGDVQGESDLASRHSPYIGVAVAVG